jgi:hypothetical protein
MTQFEARSATARCECASLKRYQPGEYLHVEKQSRVEEAKKEKAKIIAAAPSQKGAVIWQPNFAAGKKKP